MVILAPQMKCFKGIPLSDICFCANCLTLLHSERPKLYKILAFLSAVGLIGLVAITKMLKNTKSKKNKTQQRNDAFEWSVFLTKRILVKIQATYVDIIDTLQRHYTADQ